MQASKLIFMFNPLICLSDCLALRHVHSTAQDIFNLAAILPFQGQFIPTE
jgi:hypothetical protein